MSVMKLIKFDLPIDGVKVKNLEELREHFTVEILDLYHSGILLKWLQSRHLTEELDAVRELVAHSDVRVTIMKKLCEIFKLEVDDLLISIAVGEPREKLEKTFPELKTQYMAMLQKEVKIEAETKKPTVSGKYLIYKNGTVTDTQTHLMWKQDSEAGKYTWDEAMRKFGKNVSFAGYNDWRLPTIEELETLVDKQHSPTIDPIAFPNTKNRGYWSSTPNGSSGVWGVGFYYGGVGWYDRNHAFHVRLVRSGQ